jgi:hypothetical protein
MVCYHYSEVVAGKRSRTARKDGIRQACAF